MRGPSCSHAHGASSWGSRTSARSMIALSKIKWSQTISRLSTSVIPKMLYTTASFVHSHTLTCWCFRLPCEASTHQEAGRFTGELRIELATLWLMSCVALIKHVTSHQHRAFRRPYNATKRGIGRDSHLNATSILLVPPDRLSAASSSSKGHILSFQHRDIWIQPWWDKWDTLINCTVYSSANMFTEHQFKVFLLSYSWQLLFTS